MRTVWLTLSLTLNVLFIGLIISFWLQRVKIFHRVIHEIDTRAAVTFFDAYPVEPGDIVFLGDSITAGAQWAEMFPDVLVKNRGISGDRTGDVLKRLAQITTGNPAQVFLLIGTNDLGLGTPYDETLSNYAAILDQLREHSPETQVLVQSVLPREARYHDDVVALNTAIAALARARGLTTIDLFPSFVSDDGAIQEALSYDGLHLSGKGYRLWQSLLEPYTVRDANPVVQ
jgi:lysophospholipase L1-like esterase